MKHQVKVTEKAPRLAELLNGIPLSRSQMASAKARMDQAESIASGLSAAGKLIAATLSAVLHGSLLLARRIRSVFMKPAHR